MKHGHETHLASGILAGLAGGLVASWVMNEFMENLGPQLQKAVARDGGANKRQNENGDKPDDATMKTADAVFATATGGQHLSHEGKEKGGPIVHYVFGALMGAVYGAMAEEMPAITAGFGTAFGTALFSGADLVAVPALDLGPSTSAEDIPKLATPFAAHLVYGATTEAVRRLVRVFV